MNNAKRNKEDEKNKNKLVILFINVIHYTNVW